MLKMKKEAPTVSAVTDDDAAQQVKARIAAIRSRLSAVENDRQILSTQIGECLSKIETGAGDTTQIATVGRFRAERSRLDTEVEDHLATVGILTRDLDRWTAGQAERAAEQALADLARFEQSARALESRYAAQLISLADTGAELLSLGEALAAAELAAQRGGRFREVASFVRKRPRMPIGLQTGALEQPERHLADWRGLPMPPPRPERVARLGTDALPPPRPMKVFIDGIGVLQEEYSI